MNLTNLITESRDTVIDDIRYLVTSYDDKLFLIPRTMKEVEKVDKKGRVETAKEIEEFISKTFVPVTWLQSHPSNGFAFTTDWEYIIKGMS